MVIVAVTALTTAVIAGGVAWALRPSNPPAQAGSSQPAPSSSAPSTPAPSDPAASGVPTTAPSGSTTLSPQPPPPAQSVGKPRVSDFASTIDGVTITLSFSVLGNGPLQCRVDYGTTDIFGCNPGRVSRTYTFPYIGGVSFYTSVTDRDGASSATVPHHVEMTHPGPLTYKSFQAWAEGSTMFVNFALSTLTGETASCAVTFVRQLTKEPWQETVTVNCTGPTALQKSLSPGKYSVRIEVTSSVFRGGGGPITPASLVEIS